MIKVIIVSHKPENEVALLNWLAGVTVSTISPLTIEATLQQVLDNSPDIIIIEQNLEAFDTDIFSHLLYTKYPKGQSIILTDKTPTFEMLKNSGFSVRGYITKEQRSSLAKAVKVIHDGEAWLPRTIVTEMLNRFAELTPKII